MTTERWFRLYNDLLDDPKVQQLSPDLFKSLVNLWCLASKNDGFIPQIDHVSFALRCSQEQATETLSILFTAGFFDRTKQGFRPHNWLKRQFKSDVSTKRVREFRERHKKQYETVSVTPPETEQSQSRTDTPPTPLKGANGVSVSDVQKAYENYNRAAEQLDLPKAEKLTPERNRKLRARLKEHGLSGWNRALQNLVEQPFCLGVGGRGWKANLDFLLQPESLNKVLEMAYARAENDGI